MLQTPFGASMEKEFVVVKSVWNSRAHEVAEEGEMVGSMAEEGAGTTTGVTGVTPTGETTTLIAGHLHREGGNKMGLWLMRF